MRRELSALSLWFKLSYQRVNGSFVGRVCKSQGRAVRKEISSTARTYAASCQHKVADRAQVLTLRRRQSLELTGH